MDLVTSHSFIKEQITHSTPMSGAIYMPPKMSRVRVSAVYTCADGTDIYYSCDELRIKDIEIWKICRRDTLTAPMSGILLPSGEPPVAIIGGLLTSRDIGNIMYGDSSKTYAFPGTITTVDVYALRFSRIASVRLNEGLETLEEGCFYSSKIRKLVLPASVESIGKSAFEKCKHLEHADLSAAHGLKCIGKAAFHSCRALKQVRLNEGLEIIGEYCFAGNGLEMVSIPGSVRRIDTAAFIKSSLTQARFLGTAANEPHGGRSSNDAEDNHSESEQQLVIGTWAFADCKGLRQVVFEPCSVVEEIQYKAFCSSGLKSFVAPLSLRRIGTMAFGECRHLKRFKPNADI